MGQFLSLMVKNSQEMARQTALKLLKSPPGDPPLLPLCIALNPAVKKCVIITFAYNFNTKVTLVCIEMKLQSDKMTLCHATLPPPYPPPPPPPGMFFHLGGGGGGGGGKVAWHSFFHLGGGGGGGGGRGGMAQNHFSDRTLFFYLQFKNTSNLILLGFKMSSERFLFEDFKTGLTFWHI